MIESTTWVGLDVHKKTIAVAMLRPGEETPVEWSFSHDARGLRRFARRVKREAVGKLRCVYEAGPCGYAPQRELVSHGVATDVIAPSMTPVQPGDRVKTDRRDARKLVLAARAGMLTVVRPPSESEEAIRDLCRCREDVIADLGRCRHRLLKLLLRHGLAFRSGRNWTKAHREWLRSLRWDYDATGVVFVDYLGAIETLEARLVLLDSHLEAVSQEEPYREPVGWLRCFRGIDTVTAMTILAEIHDFHRFTDPRQLMSYLGLVPSEKSSGERTRRGAITKAGNSHVRRVLIEAAWHYRHRPLVGKGLRKRREGQPAAICALADRAQRRLHHRYHRLVLGSAKPPQKAIVAVARELTGFLWAALHQYPLHRSASPCSIESPAPQPTRTSPPISRVLETAAP